MEGHEGNWSFVLQRRRKVTLSANEIDRIVSCPDCYRLCGWCSWYAKNAREVGCGLRVPSGSGGPRRGRRTRGRKACEWGEQLKGTVCTTCGGAEKVRLVGKYERVTGER